MNARPEPSPDLTDKKILIPSVRWMAFFAFSILLLTGCNVNHPMIKEMEAASAAVSENLKSKEKQEEQEKAVARAMQKYFPLGMKSEEAFKLLRLLKEQGFDVGEWRHEGSRNWPDGELSSYRDDATRRNLQQQIPPGMSNFSARKQYGTVIPLLITQHVRISFRVIDGSRVISEVDGDIWASGL